MTWLQRLGAVSLGVGLVVGIAVLTRAAAEFSGGHDALIRLSWRVGGVSAQDCRTLSEEELAELPVHMRNPGACTGQIADYELRVRLGGTQVLLDTVAPGGARRDRPIYVLADLPVDSGAYDVSVRFAALVPESYDGDEPAEYLWSGTLQLGVGDIALITLDEVGATFVVRSPDPRP